MASQDIRIVDWSAHSPGRETRKEWVFWASGQLSAEETERRPVAMPMMLRRRLGMLGNRALATAYDIGELASARYLFCSRYGDFGRTLGLLQAILAKEPASPTEFSMSVHNSLAGLLSIAAKNTAGHTAIAAGPETFACGIIEAAALLSAAPDEPVLLVYYDEPLPTPYESFNEADDQSLALALLLGGAEVQRDRGEVIAFEIEPGTANLQRPTTGQALDFIRFIASDEEERLSPGERLALRWRRAA